MTTGDFDKLCDFFDTAAIERFRAARGMEPRRIRDMRNALCKHFAGANAVFDAAPPEHRRAFEQHVNIHPLQLEQRIDSQIDGATKLVFRTGQGFLVESVILRTGTGRTALCVSSQVGCAAACAFCATGHMGVARDLTAGEILDQVVQAGELLRAEERRVRNIVFMGMGEPLHNESNVRAALDALVAPEFFHHPPRYVLVSTVGIPDAMIRLARRFPQINIALSLHAARQSVREQIVPIARRYDLESLRTAMERMNAIQQRPIFVEYVMLKDVNDSPTDADALIAYLDGLNVHVNLIPFNAIDSAPRLSGTERPDRDAFARRLKEAGLTTTIRYSLGVDIAAACGQLVQRRNRDVAKRTSVANR